MTENAGARDGTELGGGRNEAETGGDRNGTDAVDEEALVGECTECGQVYSLQMGADGAVVPLGTDGTCQCGNDEFEPLTGA
ncbi:hypothetical protein ACFQMA_17570 [Halosimplex aquaticum]|uniref:Uncharacterized protein n=1 Tax=Halosimplex aquaticum TaxID=3026162 RepID=A0ABD5Y2M0_9EURY|nr:hypothetical protein [Halosimplex aquaticum]